MAAVTKYETPSPPPPYSVHSNTVGGNDACDRPPDRSGSSHKSKHSSRHASATDPIDRLDHSFGIGLEYHHEGPFDCASRARNSGPMAPIDALTRTNALALSAVPPAKIAEAVNNSRPIDGVAVPGQANVEYEAEDINVLDEFLNPMVAGRWPGEDFAAAGRGRRSSDATDVARKRSSSIRTACSSSSSSGKRRSWTFSRKTATVDDVGE
ncbi:hypothetical protein V1525DRAFT_160985 [Lipomyces kononenkoae]|uniref:Uncharacterized protein n=1 Tax=Lipomyces kononenkoae TaxID=34357 RepID=A0ACC3T0M4_LIPKO